MEVSCQLRKSCHFSNITISNSFEMFLVCNSIIIISKVNHTWIIFPRFESFLPIKLVFERILTRAFCQYILNPISKKKLGNFNDLINVYVQSFICLPRYKDFMASVFCKFSLTLLNRIQPVLERLKGNITMP